MIAVSYLLGSLLAKQVTSGGLDQPGEHKKQELYVALIEDHKLVLEELPGEILTQPPKQSEQDEVFWASTE